MNLILDSIGDDISKGNCLVILGPRLLTGDGESLNTRLNNYLKKNLPNYKEPDYYPEDGFLNIDNNIALVARGIKKFFENEVEPTDIYRKFAEIPFPLIINTSPDKTLNKVFKEINRDYDYDYFKMRDPGAKVVAREHNTMIYNIFGDYDDINSMVLTFKDLATYMVAIANLKTKIKKALSESKAVLFFGFSYDRWYFQLLLSFLKLDKEQEEKKADNTGKMKSAWDVPKEHIKNFYIKEFNVEFFPDNTAADIIDQLYQATKDGDITPPTDLADKPPPIYISYSHKTESDAIADKVEQSFTQNDIQLIRDKSSLPYKERISKFMEQIGQADGVVVVLSDAYLKSKYCMFELIEIYENKNFEEVIFPIVLDDAKIFDAKGLLSYKNHWKNKIEDLNKITKDMDDYETLRDDNKLFKQIHDSFDQILKILMDIKFVTQQEAEDSQFDAYIKKIWAMA